jgi:hypothetical protein
LLWKHADGEKEGEKLPQSALSSLRLLQSFRFAVKFRLLFCGGGTMHQKDRFNNWLLSDDFPLHLAVLFIISSAFDYFLTFQILFNDKALFLKLERNEFLIYCYQNNLWWLFAFLYSIIIIYILYWCRYVKKVPKLMKPIRILALIAMGGQLLQPILFYLLK